VQRGGRFAFGVADVRLERVAEAPIGISIGAERRENRRDGAIMQEHGHTVPVQQASIGENELLCGFDVDRHALTLGGNACRVLQKSDGSRAGRTLARRTRALHWAA
jgi:hypothetical protein